MAKDSNALTRANKWHRVREIFGDPKPPTHVWERQFDYFDLELQKLARTPWEEIDFSDLWYYHHDLAYVELQPELFAYLFPVCLVDWHETLIRNEPCSHGDSEFHYGVHRGRIFEKMLSPEQRRQVFDFFRDSFLARLNRERGFIDCGSKTPAYGWVYRFNSLGLVTTSIESIWQQCWSLGSPGFAVAAIQYCSGLMYLEGENSIFSPWTPRGGGCPCLWTNDSNIYDAGWKSENIAFLTRVLNLDFVANRLVAAADALRDEPEHETAMRVEQDLAERSEIVESRVRELPRLLANPDNAGWTI